MQSRQDIHAELALVQAARDGDDRAMAMIYQRYHDILCIDIRKYVSDDDAEDIVHDVFAALCVNRHRFHIRNTLRQYLFAAVRNRARDAMARKRTEEQFQLHANVTAYTIGARSATPADHAILLAELETLIECGLARLTPRCREALRSIAEAGSYGVLSQQLGVGIPTVHTFLWRGRREMRAYLSAHGWTELVRNPTRSRP